MHRSPVLRVDLASLTANYRLLASRFTGGECAAVVKANAYGLGVEGVAPALAKAGCRQFFVATLDEAIQLRGLLADAAIAVFHGPYEGEEAAYLEYRLLPVLNTPGQLMRWLPREAPFALHVDTGMTRLGLTLTELHSVQKKLVVPHLKLLMSHLSCANESSHSKNTEQLSRFNLARQLLPEVRASLCNSSGIFLPKEFHFDLARPGCSLYGINPGNGENPMRPVVTLEAPILQIRYLDQNETVGYGATCERTKGSRIATVQLGYSDGYFRHLSDKGIAMIGKHLTPILGRVSMDMIMLDVSDVPEGELAHETHAEFLNENLTVDAVASLAGTIGYEVLTRIGRRVTREYING